MLGCAVLRCAEVSECRKPGVIVSIADVLGWCLCDWCVYLSAGKGQADIVWPLEGLQPGHGQADRQLQGSSFAPDLHALNMLAFNIIELFALPCVMVNSPACFYMHSGWGEVGFHMHSWRTGVWGGGGGGRRASTRICRHFRVCASITQCAAVLP